MNREKFKQMFSIAYLSFKFAEIEKRHRVKGQRFHESMENASEVAWTHFCELWPVERGEQMKNRCQSVFERLDSRCILIDEHDGKHRYPNAILKKEDPDFFRQVRNMKTPITGDILSKLESFLHGEKEK